MVHSMDTSKKNESVCKKEADEILKYQEKLPELILNILNRCLEKTPDALKNFEPIPSVASAKQIIDLLRKIIFPGYFEHESQNPVNLKYSLGQSVATLFDILAGQVALSFRHDCFRRNMPCLGCTQKGHETALKVLEAIPELQDALKKDVAAAYMGDPAAKSLDEVIFCYPGLFAVFVYRAAHILWLAGVPVLPRTMSEYAHSRTGIDIHPGADIGESFMIDHGTGVVVGETTKIGENVRIYQGVTLGALSVPKEDTDRMRQIRRHPTIEDGVTIYANTTILGGETVIGARSIIGGNVWITESVQPDTMVTMEAPKLAYREAK